MGLYMGNINVEQRFIGAEEDAVATGTTDFTEFWKEGRREEIFDKVDTSEGLCFDYTFDNYQTMTRVPKKFNANKSKSAAYMFNNCSVLTALPDDFNMPECENYEKAFNGTTIRNFPKSMNMSKGINFKSAFSRQYTGSTANIHSMPEIDMSNATAADSMFYQSGLSVFTLNNTGKVTTFRHAFVGCNFTEAELDLMSCTDMRSAFNNCKSLQTLVLNNVNAITTSAYWASCFTACSKLVNLTVNELVANTSNATQINLDFKDCTKLSDESLHNIVRALVNNNKSVRYQVRLPKGALAKLSDDDKTYADVEQNVNLIEP